MAWSISDLFPPWGDAGSRPADNFQYDGGDQVNEKHLDYLWDNVSSLEDEVRSALTDIDSDKDGTVDQADDALLYKGNDIDGDGDGVVNNSNQLEGNSTSQVRNHSPQSHAGSHKDGGSDELDAAELAGALGSDGQVLTSTGAAAQWEAAPGKSTSEVQDDAIIMSEGYAPNFLG